MASGGVGPELGPPASRPTTQGEEEKDVGKRGRGGELVGGQTWEGQHAAAAPPGNAGEGEGEIERTGRRTGRKRCKATRQMNRNHDVAEHNRNLHTFQKIKECMKRNTIPIDPS